MKSIKKMFSTYFHEVGFIQIVLSRSGKNCMFLFFNKLLYYFILYNFILYYHDQSSVEDI